MAKAACERVMSSRRESVSAMGRRLRLRCSSCRTRSASATFALDAWQRLGPERAVLGAVEQELLVGEREERAFQRGEDRQLVLRPLDGRGGVAQRSTSSREW